MNSKRIGIIGGSGLYDIEGITNLKRMTLQTPFGHPSDEYTIGELEGREVVFLPRHGKGHTIMPSEINYRANIWGMKKLGVEWIISVSAVGSYKKELKPQDIVLVDQFFDRTNQARPTTFFGDGAVAHVMFSHPVCSSLQDVVYNAARAEAEELKIHRGGTYVNMEGPAFSTKAESVFFKSQEFDVIGMTNMPEARLAREAEICYVTMAMVTDYDCWIEGDPTAIVSVDMVINNLLKNVEAAKRIIRGAVERMPHERTCSCKSSLQNALITKKDEIPRETREKLDIIIGKYL